MEGENCDSVPPEAGQSGTAIALSRAQHSKANCRTCAASVKCEMNGASLNGICSFPRANFDTMENTQLMVLGNENDQSLLKEHSFTCRAEAFEKSGVE